MHCTFLRPLSRPLSGRLSVARDFDGPQLPNLRCVGTEFQSPYILSFLRIALQFPSYRHTTYAPPLARLVSILPARSSKHVRFYVKHYSVPKEIKAYRSTWWHVKNNQSNVFTYFYFVFIL